MKIAVVYYSMSGNTAYVAQKIAEATGADLIKIEPKKAFPDKGFSKFFWGGKSAVMKDKPELVTYEFIAGKYDLVVFGTPVWASTIVPPLRTFISENGDFLKSKKIAAFFCSSGGNYAKAEDKLKQALGIDKFEAVTGLIDPKEKPSQENEDKIGRFIEAIGQL